MNNPGTYIEIGGRPAVRFERRYRHPVDRIWAAIIDPAESRFWFPSTLIVEERVGGAVTFSADPNQPDATGVVLVFDPPHRLSFTWGGDEVHFQLRSDGDECVLTFTNVLEATDTAARNASGWTVCLIELDKVISGFQPTGRTVTTPNRSNRSTGSTSPMGCPPVLRFRPPTDICIAGLSN